MAGFNVITEDEQAAEEAAEAEEAKAAAAAGKPAPEKPPFDAEAALQNVQEDMRLLLGVIDADAAIAKKQNILIAIATGFGTFFWGFGDWIAEPFIGHSCSMPWHG
jgi:hypothetical protein